MFVDTVSFTGVSITTITVADVTVATVYVVLFDTVPENLSLSPGTTPSVIHEPEALVMVLPVAAKVVDIAEYVGFEMNRCSA